MKVYQPRINLVKDENGDLLAESYNILNRWEKYLSQLLNVHRVSDVRQIEIAIAIAIAKLKIINRHVMIKFRQN
jgi:hypothetical protein